MSFKAKETLSRRSEIVLSEDFAQRVNAVIGCLPDEVKLATLFANWDKRIAWSAERNGEEYLSPNLEWKDFMENITIKESTYLRKLARTAYQSFDLRTLGDIRDFTSFGPVHTYRIGPRGRAFTYLAFRKSDE